MVAVFPTVPMTSTATGAGTAESAEVAITVPSRAVEIVATRGHVHATQGDPAESVFGVFKLKGQDFKYNPYEWFSEIGSAKLGAVDQSGYALEPKWWEAHLPVDPGSTIAVTYEPLDALANNGQFLAEILWSTARTGLPIRQRLCSRETASSTATGPTLTITGAARIVDFTVGNTASTVAADDPSNGRLTVVSSAFDEAQQMSLAFNIHTIEATSGVAQTCLFRREVDIPVSGDPAVITSSITVDTALTTASAYAYSIGYLVK